MMRVFTITWVCVLCAAAVTSTTRAQLVTTQLPTPYAGDYLNGAATSDAAGGFFVTGERAQPAPTVAFGIPTAFGADWRDLFAALGGHVGRSQGRWFKDGAVFLGGGAGDSQHVLGVEATFTVYDLVGDTFDERSLSVKLHRRLGRDWAVAVGIENMMFAGYTDGGKSLYGVVSGMVPLRPPGERFSRLTLTAGLGDGRFNSYRNVRHGRNEVGPFLGIALCVSPTVNVLVSWTGQDLNAGVSLAPFSKLPVVITPVLLDVDGTGGHGARFAASVGVGTTF